MVIQLSLSVTEVKDKMDEKGLIHASYERITPYFYLIEKMYESKTRPTSLKLAGIKDGDSILIIAPPTEFYNSTLLKANLNGKNYLLYFSKNMEEKAEKKLKKKFNYKLDVCLEDNLPYNDNLFDHVFAYCYFDFLNETGIEIAVKEIKRILKPGGNLMATYFSNPTNFSERFSVSLTSRISFLKDIHVVEVGPLVQKNNFKNITIKHYSQLGAPVDLIYAEK